MKKLQTDKRAPTKSDKSRSFEFSPQVISNVLYESIFTYLHAVCELLSKNPQWNPWCIFTGTKTNIGKNR